MTTTPVPCFAVIFVSQRTPGDGGYGAMAERMEELGKAQPGFLGIESVRGPDGRGITVAFYESEEAARAWGRNDEHREAQRQGRADWYQDYQIYYARVERVRDFRRPKE